MAPSTTESGCRTAYIGLGANLGSPEASLRAALHGLEALPGTWVTRVSSLYRTAPVGVTDQPDFLNAVAALQTALAPEPLLDALLHLENSLGRVRTRRWGPRVIDLDLLLYGDQTIMTERLTVPHPRLGERAFALVPLAEIAPEVVLPGTGGLTAKEKAATVLQDGNILQVHVVPQSRPKLSLLGDEDVWTREPLERGL